MVRKISMSGADAEIEALLAAWRRLTDMANIGRRAANAAATEDPDTIAQRIRSGGVLDRLLSRIGHLEATIPDGASAEYREGFSDALNYVLDMVGVRS